MGGALAATSFVFLLLARDKPQAESVSFACAPSFLSPGVACAARF